jgi:hypothetical protein
MSKLNAEAVSTIIKSCLFKEGEDTANHVKAEGVVSAMGFHPDRLKAHAAQIGELLAELPEQFQADTGGGWSFLNACMDKDGNQWGEHRNIDELLMLGIATGQAKILMPRNMWSMFPGGMPYFVVTKPQPVEAA